MSLPRAALPFVLGAALAAAQDAAPLAETKQQLQSLKKDQAAQKAKADDGLRLGDALPNLAVPVAEPAGPASPAARQRERERQEKAGTAGRNWLVDGYGRLDRAGRDARLDGTEEELADEEPLDPRDPDYFLRVYERQRAATEVRRERERETRDGATAAGGVAAMEPFLRNWLAGSPVEGVLREARGERRGGEAAGFDLSGPRDGAAVRFDEPAAGAASRDTGPVARFEGPATTAGTPAVNPYLAALGLDRGAAGGATAPVFTPPPPVPAPAPVWAPPPPPKAEAPRLPVRPEDEAKKYFPQLRKF